MIDLLAYVMLIAGLEPAVPPPPKPAVAPPAETHSVAGSASRSDQPTAEDLLKALQRERPLNEVIPPGSTKGGEWPKTKRKLLPEGSTIIERSGVVAPDDDGWRFRFDGSGADPDYRLLPNALLEVLIHAVDTAGERVHFVISGETTTFQEANFLLLRGASRAAPSSGIPVTRTPTPAGAAPAMPKAAGPPSSAPPEARTDADPADVLNVLREKQPARAMVASAPPPTGDAATRRGQRTRTLLPDGSPLIDRPGRVLREGSGWVFVPETDRPDRPEPTLRLLPNQGTESITKTPGADAADMVFVLSGEITQFQGENYLLPRAVVRRMSTDNLRK